MSQHNVKVRDQASGATALTLSFFNTSGFIGNCERLYGVVGVQNGSWTRTALEPDYSELNLSHQPHYLMLSLPALKEYSKPAARWEKRLKVSSLPGIHHLFFLCAWYLAWRCQISHQFQANLLFGFKWRLTLWCISMDRFEQLYFSNEHSK